MAAQHTLMVVPATLFSTTPGSEDDLGACERISECLVALVALATLPTPKFRIVCYTRDQRTLCAVRLQESACDGQLTIPARSSSSSSPNVDLLHLRDGSDARVFVLHLMAAEDGERLLAAVAAALYTMAGSPAHTTYSYDATRRSSNLPGPFLQVGDEAQAHYRAYTTRHMGTSPLLEVLPSQPTWKQHTFRTISSTASLLHTSRGFEGSTLGMRPGSTRIVVVPPELPNRSPAANSSHTVEVYLLYLPREAPTPEAPPPSCVPPTLAIPDWDDDDGKKKRQTTPACRGSSANIVPDAAPSSMLELRLELHAAMTAADELQQVGAAIDDAVRRSSRQHEVTVLPPESLIAKVQDFVAEHKRLEGELQDRDRTLCLLDERTMHLKKKLEESSAAAQALMDGQKEAAMTCINEKLRTDRQALQLQEKVAQLINTKEDHRRHLETTRSLLHLCEEEVRRARAQRTGKEDEASQLRQALDRVKEDLHRERSRHGSLESTLAAQQEQILALRADMRGKTVQIQELKMVADAERDVFMRRLEELRREKAAEVRGVRDDAMQQLEHLDATHRQHMAQEAESAYKRGRREGMTQGMQNESEDVAMVQQERSIAAERRAAELTACRTELRTSIETASTVRRALLSAVDGLRREVSEAAARKAEWDRRLQEKKGTQHGVFVRRVRHFVSHLHDRVTPAQLLDVLRQLRESNDADVGFLAHNREEARRESLSRRARWVEEELLYIYKRGEEHYFDEWRNALMEAHRTTAQAVRTLWVQHSGMAHYQLHVAEVEGRVTIQQEWSGGFHAVQKWYADLLAERESLWKEAVVAMNDSWKESMEECARINRWANALLAEQEYCLGSEEHARLRIATGAMTSLAGIVAEGTARIFALRVGELMGMESGAREAISTEESAEMVSYVASLDRLRSHWRQHQAQHTPANLDPTPRTTTPPRVAVQEEEEDFPAPPHVLVEDVHETRPSPPRAHAERSSPSDASPIPFQPSLPDEAPPPPQDDESEAVDVQPVCEAHVPEEVPRNVSPSPQTAALFAVNFDDAPPEMEED